MVIFSEL